MNDVLTSAREEGYQAFLSGYPVDINPFSPAREWVNWCSWEAGYREAEKDNSAMID